VPQRRADAKLFYYHCDQIGTPQLLTDDDGDVVWEASYKAWGEAREVIARASKAAGIVARNSLRFQGQQEDEETGLAYNRHRYYDPMSGRFVSKDPIGLAGGINVYQYAPNPIAWIDPRGLSKRCPMSTRGLGKATGSYSAMKPGPLPDDLAATFAGGRYKSVTLAKDTVLHRAGTAGRPLGQFFSQEAPAGVLQTRIDKAVLPTWPGGGTSPIDTAFGVKIPAGTQVFVGEVGSQGGFYVGGTQQVVVPKPWTIEGVEVTHTCGLK
ncbi:RHS repeat-associated core domain-containing protein, partial [Burkholderia multivorans]